MRRVPRWLAGSLVLGAFVLLIWQERRRPFRKRIEPDLKHGARNLAIAAVGAIAMFVFESPLVQPLARLVEQRRWGLMGKLQLPIWAEAALAILLMDYTFYVWHVLLHRAPLLWRFHAVHHVDLDLDTTTALRFHFGELLVSVPWRAAQVLAIGLSPFTFAAWQVWFALCVMFHHSNVRLPNRWERRINRILVTPRMHGVHHSNHPDDTNSNWSSGLTMWDWLHGTLRLGISQNEIEIGIPAFHDPSSIVLPKLLTMPFEEQPVYWRFPDGRQHSTRQAPPSNQVLPE